MTWFIERYRNSRLVKWTTNSTFLAVVIHILIMEVPSWLHRAPANERSFVTQRAEFRCESLPEGSHVCLDGDSEIRVRFNGSTRNIEVLRGKVSFVVQNDTKPFDVWAARVLLHDLSTGFVVSRQQPNLTRVTVTEGRVRIVAPADTDLRSQFERGEVENAWKSAPELQRFDQMEYDEIGRQWHALPQLTARQLSSLLAFEVGRIDLHDRTLAESLKELARYQDPPIFKCSAATGDTRLDGEFLFNDLDGLLAALKFQYHIHHATSGSGSTKVITLTRPSDKAGEIQPRC